MDLIIFDLDGTLIDSKVDLANAVNAARVHLGKPPLDTQLISSYVGNGAPLLIRRALGPEATEAEIQQALEYFLQYYGEHCLDYTDLYPGVRQALDQMHADGAHLAVLTNKPVVMSRKIVDGLGLHDHFFRVYGGNSFEQKKPDPVGIRTLMAEAGGTAPARTLMVGDSSVDVRTARNAGVPVAAVSYGFQPESLVDNPPDYLVDRMEAVAEIVIATRKGDRKA